MVWCKIIENYSCVCILKHIDYFCSIFLIFFSPFVRTLSQDSRKSFMVGLTTCILKKSEFVFLLYLHYTKHVWKGSVLFWKRKLFAALFQFYLSFCSFLNLYCSVQPQRFEYFCLHVFLFFQVNMIICLKLHSTWQGTSVRLQQRQRDWQRKCSKQLFSFQTCKCTVG